MSDFQHTMATLKSGIDTGLHPGAQIYVSRAGRALLDEAVGAATRTTPMTIDSLCLWMSAGKPIAAVAALQMVARGLIELQTRIDQVIPGFGVNGKSDITLEHILTHTAGFRGPLNNFTAGSWQEIVQRACELRQEPGWIPGQRAGYHIGSSWFVIGRLVELLDGRSFSSYIRQAIFSPLGVEGFCGMEPETLETLRQRLVPMQITEPHFSATPGKPADDWPGNADEAIAIPRPGANCRGPISALAHVYESLLDDERLLPRDLCTQMRTRQRIGMMDQTFKQTLDWGLGVMIDSKQYAGEHQYGFGPHASPDTFGHSGNQSSCAFADPAFDLVVAWACNGMPGEAAHQARARAINAAIYRDIGLAS